MKSDDETIIDEAVLTSIKNDLPKVDTFHDESTYSAEDHVDERWLVSYADMMTLLFGLFVMLYALQDPVQFEKMKESVSEKFSAVPDKQPAPQVDLQKLLDEKIEKEKKMERELVQQQTETAQALTELKQLRLQNIELKSNIEKSRENRQIASVQERDNESLKSEIEQLKSELEFARQPNDSETKLKAMAQKIRKQEEQIRELASAQQSNMANQAQTETLNRKNEDLEKKIIDLSKELEEEKGRSKPNKNFLAIIVNWPTNDHDLDLVVQDPTGKTFDFKKRSFPNHPGAFALDTRRGPGTEVWQTDNLIPGRYRVKVIFYNQYGNKSATKAQLTLFSSYGKTELPEFALDLASKRSKELLFEVKNDGKIAVL